MFIVFAINSYTNMVIPRDRGTKYFNLSFKFLIKVLMKVKYITSGFLQWIGTWEYIFFTLAKEPIRWKIHFLLKAI